MRYSFYKCHTCASDNITKASGSITKAVGNITKADGVCVCVYLHACVPL